MFRRVTVPRRARRWRAQSDPEAVARALEHHLDRRFAAGRGVERAGQRQRHRHAAGVVGCRRAVAGAGDLQQQRQREHERRRSAASWMHAHRSPSVASQAEDRRQQQQLRAPTAIHPSHPGQRGPRRPSVAVARADGRRSLLSIGKARPAGVVVGSDDQVDGRLLVRLVVGPWQLSGHRQDVLARTLGREPPAG